MPSRPNPRSGAGRRLGLSVVADTQPDGVALPAYVDRDAGRAPGVPYGVGERLLREPVERGVARVGQPGRTGQRDLDGGRRVGARQSRQVRDTRLRCVGDGSSSRSTRTIDLISARVRDASDSIAARASAAFSGSGAGDHATGLRLHRDGRDVVGHGVVQLARQRHPLLDCGSRAVGAARGPRGSGTPPRGRRSSARGRSRRGLRPSRRRRRTSPARRRPSRTPSPRPSLVPSPTAPGSRAGSGRPSWRGGRGPRRRQSAGGPRAARRRPTRPGRPSGGGSAARAGQVAAPGRAPSQGVARPGPAERCPRARRRPRTRPPAASRDDRWVGRQQAAAHARWSAGQ